MTNKSALIATAFVILTIASVFSICIQFLGPLEAIAACIAGSSVIMAIAGYFFLNRIHPFEDEQKSDASSVKHVADPQPSEVGSSSEESDKENPSELSLTDAMTGLGNQHRMQEKFTTLKNTEDCFCVGVVNLVGMKPINDLYGYEGGDSILKQVSQRISSALGDKGFVFRRKGDEFGLLLLDVQTHHAARELGTMLQELLSGSFDLGGQSVRVSGSFGFVITKGGHELYDEVLDRAESALYHSRHSSNRITVHTDQLENQMAENTKLEQALRQAISDDSVNPHFQPIISLQSGRLLGFEALARWTNPEMGPISPAKFIPLAEQRGVIGPLTERLLQKAARTAAEWPKDVFLSFNLSSVQLVDPNTAKSVLSTIERAGLEPERLEVEVTETAMMSDPTTASQVINELSEAGVRISMDDFGTGQSSLGRLRELKLDKVKIDRAFVMAIGQDKPAEHIIRAILEMCAGLELMVVAEGIEDVGQAASLKRFGCHAGQGFLFGKPQDEHHTQDYIREFMLSNTQAAPKNVTLN